MSLNEETQANSARSAASRYNSIRSCLFQCFANKRGAKDQLCSQRTTHYFNFGGWRRRGIGSFFIYRAEQRERSIEKAQEQQKIPVLEFDGFFKAFGTEVGERGMVYRPETYFVRVKNVNQHSEGRAESCTGFFTIAGTTIIQYPTVWQDNDVRYLSFANSANLMLFTTKKQINTIIFPRAYAEVGFACNPESYNEYVTKEITITLESERGTCPKGYTKKIQEIIDEAK